jgi:hypothetical protein
MTNEHSLNRRWSYWSAGAASVLLLSLNFINTNSAQALQKKVVNVPAQVATQTPTPLTPPIKAPNFSLPTVSPREAADAIANVRRWAAPVLAANVFRAELTQPHSGCPDVRIVHDIDLRRTPTVVRYREMRADGPPTSESSASWFEYREIGQTVFVGERQKTSCADDPKFIPLVWRAEPIPALGTVGDAPDDRLVAVMREFATAPNEQFEVLPSFDESARSVTYTSSVGDRFDIEIGATGRVESISSEAFGDLSSFGAEGLPRFVVSNVGVKALLVDPRTQPKAKAAKARPVGSKIVFTPSPQATEQHRIVVSSSGVLFTMEIRNPDFNEYVITDSGKVFRKTSDMSSGNTAFSSWMVSRAKLDELRSFIDGTGVLDSGYFEGALDDTLMLQSGSASVHASHLNAVGDPKIAMFRALREEILRRLLAGDQPKPFVPSMVKVMATKGLLASGTPQPPAWPLAIPLATLVKPDGLCFTVTGANAAKVWALKTKYLPEVIEAGQKWDLRVEPEWPGRNEYCR